MDTSGSLSNTAMTRMLAFSANLTSRLTAPVGPDALRSSRVASLHFDSTAVVDFNFMRFNNASAAAAAIRNTTRVVNGGTATNLAVTALQTQLFLVRSLNPSGWRNSTAIPSVALFITDGTAWDTKKFETAIATFDRTFGDRISRFAVGIGNYNATQLLMMTKNKAANVFMFTTFSALTSSFVDTLLLAMYCNT